MGTFVGWLVTVVEKFVSNIFIEPGFEFEFTFKGVKDADGDKDDGIMMGWG